MLYDSATNTTLGIQMLLLLTAAIANEPADLVGTWDVKMTANYSTCDVVTRGDINAQQWIVSVKSGALTVTVVNEDNNYVGKINEKGSVILVDKRDNHLATVELTGTPARLTGRRVVANNGPCAIIYDIELTH